MLPPRWLRRVVLAPLAIVATVVLLTSLPVLVILAAAASPLLPGRWRPLRLLWFALVYLAVESAGLLAAFVLWVASGFGAAIRSQPFETAHYALLRWCLGAIVRSARRVFHLAIDVDQDPAVTAPAISSEAAPLVVLSRHAGPGDSFLLVNGLLQGGQRPRIVLKAALQWEPLLDVVLNRLPTTFVGGGPARGRAKRAIGQLAGSMDAGDALVIFPEGGNFTEERRLRSIAKLEELGQHDRAEQARQMRYVLAPRPGGALEALEQAPTADVLLVAHTGTEDLSSVVDIWRGLPMDSDLKVKVWRIHAADLPDTASQRAAWLFEWWRRIDAWILDHRGEQAVPDALVERVRAERPPPPPATAVGDEG